MKRLALFAAAFALAGCLNFDEAYQQYLDQHDAGVTGGGDGATGGGAATTGGGAGITGGGAATTGGGDGTTGGGTATGGGDGTTGGGTATGGGVGSTGGGSATGGGTPDAGCLDGWCPYLEYVAPQVNGETFYPQQPHVVGVTATSLGNFSIWVNRFLGPAYDWNYVFTDGGVDSYNRTSLTLDLVQGYAGDSTTDFWLATRSGAQHFVGTQVTDLQPWALTDGGMLSASSPDFFGAYVAAPNEIWFAGSYSLLCRWDTVSAVCTWADDNTSSYLYDVYKTPAGEVYAVGYLSGGAGIIVNEVGTRQSYPVVDDPAGWSFVQIDGVNERVYVTSNTGHIIERGADGGFEIAFTTDDTQNGHVPYPVWGLDVTPWGEAFVGGAHGKVLYTDGTDAGWRELTLPYSANHPEVMWHQVAATSDGLILAGSEDQGDGGWLTIVNAYRKAP